MTKIKKTALVLSIAIVVGLGLLYSTDYIIGIRTAQPKSDPIEALYQTKGQLVSEQTDLQLEAIRIDQNLKMKTKEMLDIDNKIVDFVQKKTGIIPTTTTGSFQ